MKWRLLSIVLLGLMLRLLFFNGLMRHDDVMYLIYVRMLYNNISSISHISGLWGVRFSIYLPILLMIKLASLVTSDFYYPAFFFPVLSSILSIIFVYLIANELFDERTALMSSFLYAILPLDIFCSTTIRGDVESVMYFLMAFWSSLKYRKNDNWLLLFGLSLILIYTSKLPLIIPALVLALVFVRPRKWIPLLLMAFLVVELDFLIFGHSSMLSIVVSYYQHDTPSGDISTSPELGACMLTNIITPECRKALNSIIFQNSYWTKGSFMLTSFYFLAALAVAPWGIKNRRWNKLMLAVLIFSLYMIFGFMGIGKPFHKEPRYFLYVFSTISILLGYGMSKIRDILPWMLIFLFFNISILESVSNYWYRIPDTNLDVAYRFVSADHTHDIIADSLIYFYIDMRSGYNYCSRLLGIPGSQCLTDLGTMRNLTVSRPTYVVMTDLFTYPALNNKRHPDAEPMRIFGNGSTAVRVYEINP